MKRCPTSLIIQFSAVQSLSRVWLFATPWITAARPSCPSPTPRVYSNSCPLSWWCHPAISFSVIPFSSCPQSLPASGSFQMSQLFASGDHNTGVSASASVLPMNTQDWSPLGCLGCSLGRTDVEAETPIFWSPDAKSWLIWKDPDVGKDWRQEKKRTTEDEMIRWHHWLNEHEFV